MPHHLFSQLVHLKETFLGHLLLAGMTLLRFLTIYNKVQEALEDEGDTVATLVITELRRIQKRSITILAVLLSYYAQLGYSRAAGWLAFLLLISSFIIASCDNIHSRDFHSMRPVPFVLVHSVPSLSVWVVLLVEMIRASGSVIVIVVQMFCVLCLGLSEWLLRQQRRGEQQPQSVETTSRTFVGA
ncbi:hypothetical protein K435DRAFT_860375 [Dendrothele bispora CBS 962.96]|uniref:Uncharacterized protein n=1 Tax=Dendrothele bispora (strain CBS 962.96) TaxID=1314807 RepID=A0A4S8LYD9_DENBC|nr:hypothetical protein K435DRAFT_860375 [Dendrothele bispora CBS 962.96]